MNKELKTRSVISIIACIIVGLTLVVSGSGKLLQYGEIPGQTAEFIGYVLPRAWLTSTTVFLLYDVLIPYVIPVVELAVGIFLVIGFLPRIMAVITLPLTWVFMANNIFSISQGLAKYPSCECFGIWETMFGTLTPAQSLIFDIVLFVLAVVIIFVEPLKFSRSRDWMENLGKKRPEIDEAEA